VITNPYGTKEDTSELKVRCKPEIKQSLKDVEAKEGDKNVAFTCKADGYPDPKIKWYMFIYYLILILLLIKVIVGTQVYR